MYKLIYRYDYNFLESILWDTKKTHFTGKELLYLCEKRYAYYDYKSLTDKERELIEMLIKEYGNGIFLI